jgi:hypothetical protein
MKIEELKKKAKELGYSSFEGIPMFKGEIVPKGKLAFDFSYDVLTTCFDRLDDIENTSGLYQIFTLDGLPLKVGIAKNLRSRLNQHLKSSQKRLRPSNDGEVLEPSHLQSKQSILAKHLYFDSSLTHNNDLKTESGRRNFLTKETYLLITYTHDRKEAERLEKIAERADMWRYKGRVKII